MSFIGLCVAEVFGLIIPPKKVTDAVSSRIAPGKNPLGFPQFFALAAVLTLIYTTLISLTMTLISMLMGSVPLSHYWLSVGETLPGVLVIAYVCELILLPFSIWVSEKV